MINAHTVLYILHESSSTDFAYSVKNENLIELSIDIQKACDALKINTKNITPENAERVANYINGAAYENM